MIGSADPQALGLDPRLPGAGFNVAGVVEPTVYDAQASPAWALQQLLPGCQAVVVLATGGTRFFRSFRSAARPGLGDHALDAFTRGVVEAAAAHEGRAGFGASCAFYWEQRGGRFLDFPGLAVRAGLGARSRLSLILHPEFGPWLAVRALLFTTRALLPTEPDPSFDPCTGCAAPCSEACPGAALPAAGFDLAACLATTEGTPACRTGCGARRACVVGPAHRYDADAEAWHRESALGIAPPPP